MFKFSWIAVVVLVAVLFFSSGVMAAGAPSACTAASCGVVKKAAPVQVVKTTAKKFLRPFARVREARGKCGCR